MRFGMFGGTFDPFHQGHLAIVEGVLASGRIDHLFVIPAGLPAQKPLAELTFSGYRYYMTKAALKEYPEVTVLPLEVVKKTPSYTLLTRDEIRSLGLIAPEDELYFVYGADVVEGIETWYEPQKLLFEAKLLLAKRLGLTPMGIEQKVQALKIKYHTDIAFFAIEGLEVSSGQIKKTRDFSLCPKAVEKFIQKHDLYAPDNPLSGLKEQELAELWHLAADLFQELSEKRFLHSLNVMILAAKYAKHFHMDVKAAAVAGLLHDCAKELKADLRVSLAGELEKDIASYPKTLWHSPAGAVYARNRYGISDPAVLDAIRYHSTGRCDMTALEEVIFLADKLEPARDYSDLLHLRRLAWTDVRRATYACLKAVKHSFDREGKPLHPDSVQALLCFEKYFESHDELRHKS